MSPHLQVRVWVCEARCQTTGALAPDTADDRAVLPAVLSPKGQNPALAGMFEPRMGLEAHHTRRCANPVTMRVCVCLQAFPPRRAACTRTTGDDANKHAVRPRIQPADWLRRSSATAASDRRDTSEPRAVAAGRDAGDTVHLEALRLAHDPRNLVGVLGRELPAEGAR